MPDVGVLNLQIQENSELAVQGLNKLDDALIRIKHAVSGGIKLSPVATSIAKLGKVINDEISGSTITKIGQLADELSKLKGLENINIKINTGTSVESVRQAVEKTMESVGGINEGFDDVGQRAAETTSTVSNLVDEMQKLDPSKLPIQSLGEEMGDSARDMVQYGDMIKKSFETVRDSGHMGNVISQVQEYGETVNAIIPYHENLENTWERIAERMSEAKQEATAAMTAAPTDGVVLYKTIEEAARSMGITVQEANKLLQESMLKAGWTPPTVSVFSSAEEAARYLGVSVREAESNVDDLQQREEEASEATRSLTERLRELAHAARHTRFGNLLAKLGQIARYRFLRSIIKNVTEGFREGLENVYNYSKAIGGDLAPAMDSAVSSLLQMKNSIGAAVSPLIQSLIPLMQTLVGWFIEGVNYLNQFLALLRGQKTWTRALPQTVSAFDKQTKAAKKTGNAIKDLLADWDELNIIQSETSGAGSNTGKTVEDYLNMFEEVKEYDSTIKGLAEGIQEQFGGIMNLVAMIGTAIAGWKVSTLMTGTLATLGGLIATGAIIDLSFNLTMMLDKEYFKTGDIGWLIGDVLQTAIGAYLANRVVSGVISKGAGKVAAGVTLTLSAVADIIALIGSADVSALSLEGILTTVKSGLKLGGGFALFAMASGVPTAEAILAGGEVAAIGIGAVIAIKAIADAVNTGEITFETVKSGVAGAVAAGLGVTVFELIGGATLGAALSVGGVAALAIGAGFAVALGVVAMIRKQDVKWGDITLTNEQVQEFVNSKMFTVSIPVTVSIIDESLTNLSSDKKDIETKVTEALGTLNVIKLGVAKDEDYTELKKAILGENMDGSGGIVGAVSGYIEDAKNLGKLTLQFTPSLAGSDTTDASTWFTSYTSGWDKVDEFVKAKGAAIGKLLTTEEGKKIIESTPEVLAALMQQVSDVTNAIAGAKISSEAFANMQIQIGDLDKASYQQVISAYSDYVKELTEKERQLVMQQYTTQGELVAALIATGANENEEPLKSAIAKYKYMGEHINDAIEEGVRQYSKPGATMVLEFLQDRYSETLNKFKLDLDDVENLMGLGTYLKNGLLGGRYDINQVITGLIRRTNSDLADAIEKSGIYAWNVMGEDAQAKIREAMEEAFGVAETEDLIKKWEMQTKDQIDESIKNVTNGKSVYTTGIDNFAAVGAKSIKLPNSIVIPPSGGTQATPEESKANISGGVRDGISSMQIENRQLMNQLITAVNRIAGKKWSINVMPNSAWGAHNARSNDEYNVVVGG